MIRFGESYDSPKRFCLVAGTAKRPQEILYGVFRYVFVHFYVKSRTKEEKIVLNLIQLYKIFSFERSEKF
jgi:hypothetical protein